MAELREMIPIIFAGGFLFLLLFYGIICLAIYRASKRLKIAIPGVWYYIIVFNILFMLVSLFGILLFR